MSKFYLNNRNGITSIISQYHGQPILKSQNFMPWYKILNKDFDDDVILRMLLTYAVKK